jgi:hypothetical protein
MTRNHDAHDDTTDTIAVFQFFHRDLRAIVIFVLKPSARAITN